MHYTKQIILGMMFISSMLLQGSAATLNKRCGRESNPLRINIQDCFESEAYRAIEKSILFTFDKKAREEKKAEQERYGLALKESWIRQDLEAEEKSCYEEIIKQASSKQLMRKESENSFAEFDALIEKPIALPLHIEEVFQQCCICGSLTDMVDIQGDRLVTCQECLNKMQSRDKPKNRVCVFCRALNDLSEKGNCSSCEYYFRAEVCDAFQDNENLSFKKYRREGIEKKVEETMKSIAPLLHTRITEKDVVWNSLEESFELARSSQMLGGLKIYAGTKRINGIKNHIWLTQLALRSFFSQNDVDSLLDCFKTIGIIDLLSVPTGTEFECEIPNNAICLPIKK